MHVYMETYMCVHVCVYENTYVCAYVCASLCVYVYKCVCVYMRPFVGKQSYCASETRDSRSRLIYYDQGSYAGYITTQIPHSESPQMLRFFYEHKILSFCSEIIFHNLITLF